MAESQEAADRGAYHTISNPRDGTIMHTPHDTLYESSMSKDGVGYGIEPTHESTFTQNPAKIYKEYVSPHVVRGASIE